MNSYDNNIYFDDQSAAPFDELGEEKSDKPNLRLRVRPTIHAGLNGSSTIEKNESTGGGGHRHVRQASWYEDMLGQGLSPRDIASLLGENNGEDEAEMEGVEADLFGVRTCGSFSDEAVMEQRRIMALSEAKQRLQERGYHRPELRTSVRRKDSDDDEEGENVLLPSVKMPRRARKGVPPNIPISAPPKPMNWEPPQSLLNPRVARQADLQLGNVVSSTIHNKVQKQAGLLVARCLGCRQRLSVSNLATLVKCPRCSTVSPACSTRK